MGLFDKKEKEQGKFISKGVQTFGMVNVEIIMDRETGANYVVAQTLNGSSVSITPRLDDVGNPMIDEIEEEDDEEDDQSGDDDDPEDDEDDEDDGDEGDVIVIGGEDQIAVPGKDGTVFFTFD